MTEAEVLQLIQDFIVANGNNEITADVLRPILEEMLKQPNLLIGLLGQLQTADQSNLVNAINEVYGMISGITDFGVQLHEGTADPNLTPPSQYNIADFYIQKDNFNNPIQLWQYNGIGWFPMLTIFDVINDGLTGTDTTWSSDKIVSEIGNNISTSITIISDSTVALNVVNKEAYYGIQTSGALLSLPTVVGFESKKFIISNLSAGTINVYSNNGTDFDILNNGVSINQLSIPSGNVVTLFNDGLKWVVKSAEVSGTANQIVVTTGNITPTIGISPAYTTARNNYADSKVQDTISDGIIDKAPSQNAVFDALALKEGLISYKQQVLFDFNFNTNIVAASGFTNTAINGGALSLQSDSLTPLSLRTSRGDDISECWVVRGNAGSPNGGYTVGVSGQNAFYVGHVMFMAIDVSKTSDTNGRFGLVFNNAFSPLTSIAGNNAICVEIVGSQLTFKTSVAGSGVSIAPSYTIPVPQWLYIMIESETATTIRCKIRNGLNGPLVYNELISSGTNIPLSSNLLWNQLRISLNAVATVASADNMFQYGKIATYAKKPNFLNYF